MVVVKYTMATYNKIMCNKDRFSIATMCENWRSIAGEYDLSVELDHCCQAENMDGDKGRETKEEITAITTKEGFRAVVLHGPFNELFPAAIDPKARELAMKRFNEAAQTAISFGIKTMVVHSGYIPFVYFKEWHRDRSIEFWKEFMEDKPADFSIAIENVLDDDPYTLAEIAEKASDDRIGLCLDVGHANVVSELSINEWIDVFAPHLKHLHIHNNDGSGDYHRDLDCGTLDIAKIIDRVNLKTSNKATFTIEVLEGLRSVEWLAEKQYLRKGNSEE